MCKIGNCLCSTWRTLSIFVIPTSSHNSKLENPSASPKWRKRSFPLSYFLSMDFLDYVIHYKGFFWQGKKIKSEFNMKFKVKLMFMGIIQLKNLFKSEYFSNWYFCEIFLEMFESVRYTVETETTEECNHVCVIGYHQSMHHFIHF